MRAPGVVPGQGKSMQKDVLKLLRERRQLAADLKSAPAASSRVIAAAISEIDAELERRSRQLDLDLGEQKSKKS